MPRPPYWKAESQPLDFWEVPEPSSLKGGWGRGGGGMRGGAGEARPRRAVPEPHTYRLAEVTCAGVHALLPLAVAAAPTSVDGHTWRFKEGVCGCSKLLPHIYTHLPWHALSLSPLIINTCRVTGKAISYTDAKVENPTAVGSHSQWIAELRFRCNTLKK